MSFLNKLGIGAGAGGSREVPRAMGGSGRPRTNSPAPAAAVGTTRAPELRESSRVSNGLKEFLWNLDGLGRGTLLDLGPAWQTTLSFFIERGFRVSSEDLLRAWKEFLVEEEGKLREATGRAAQHTLDVTPAARAARFLEANLQYPNSSFDAVLLWDLLDYLEPVVAKQLVANLTELLRPGGVVFAMFHSKKTGRLPALSRCGFHYAASDFLTRFVPRTARLSKSRDSGSLQPLPNREVIRRP